MTSRRAPVRWASMAWAGWLAMSACILAGGCTSTERPDGGVGLLAAGAAAPTLKATAHDGSTVDLAATPIALVYFYPKDATPGCTREACAFRDVWARFQAAGVLVVGVSADDQASHIAFAEDQALPFPLVPDTDLTWAKAFGVPTFAGVTKRVSFLLRDGKVAKVYPEVDPGVHANDVLADVGSGG